MRIAHVVTYISADGAFGGPVRVALEQAAALAELGHDVHVYAGAPRGEERTLVRDGYTLRTFPAGRIAPFGGFASMSSPRLSLALRKDMAGFDAAHIHMARDLVTLPAALQFRQSKVPYVLQTHGMIDASDSPLAAPLDRLFTAKLLRDASRVLTLTAQEVEDIHAVESRATTLPIVNGIRVTELSNYRGRPSTVLFLARMHERKRPVAFVKMAAILAARYPETRFLLAGPDEGEAENVQAAIRTAGLGRQIQWIGAVNPDDTHALLASASVYVLPAVGEIFPMTILEALRVGTPVVTTSSLGIADACLKYNAATITDGSPEDLASAVDRLLANEGEAELLRAGGLNYLRSELDISKIAQTLETIYRSE